MLVHLAKAGNGCEVGFVKAFSDLPGVRPCRTDIGNAAAAHDDLLIVEPLAHVDVKQPANPQQPVCRALAERDQRQVLAHGDLIGAVDEQVVGQASDGFFRSSAVPHLILLPARPDRKRPVAPACLQLFRRENRGLSAPCP